MEKLSDTLARIKNKLVLESSPNQENSTDPQNSEAIRISVIKTLKHLGIADDCIAKRGLWSEKARQLSERMEKDKIGLFMFGLQGRKKTTCATAILEYELLRKIYNKSPYHGIGFVFVPDLMLELQGCFSNKESAADIIYRVTYPDFLVLDGMGEGGRQSEFVVGSLGTIIHHRHANRLTKRTVITCNYTLQELAEDRLKDARISSRIGEMCEDYEFGGEDQRMKR